ncbi:MAG: hypothetical protein NC302_01845 [Bacteroidales bacterium]|nr:hypothetical protein [Bacteroidales bacterium]MCM1416890.1 hypothetical protein [bacterium]MCM1422406.1 hypothetical protein [bacterium]
MKKTFAVLLMSLTASFLLCACSEETQPLLSSADYELDAETSQTIRGVKIGDDAEAFLAAYRGYYILSSIGGGDYRLLDAEDIPFDASLTTLLPSFFVDGAALDVGSFCEENGITPDGLLDYLTDENYLNAHTVVYRYLVFTWKDGAITDISSESMDYNRDASFYEAN